MPALIVKAVVDGALLPMLNKVPPPFMEAKHAGAAESAAENDTVAIVPVVAVPPTMVSVPRVLLHEKPLAQATDVTPVPGAKVAVPVGIDSVDEFVHVIAVEPPPCEVRT